MALDLTATKPTFPLGTRSLYLEEISFFRSSGMAHFSKISLISAEAWARLSSELLSMLSSFFSILGISLPLVTK